MLSSNDSGIESINNLDEIDVNSPPIALEVCLPLEEDVSINIDAENGEISPRNYINGVLSPTNPIPKPERGKFISLEKDLSPGLLQKNESELEFDFETQELHNDSTILYPELHLTVPDVTGTLNTGDEPINDLGLHISPSVAVPDFSSLSVAVPDPSISDTSDVKLLNVGSMDTINLHVSSSTPNKTIDNNNTSQLSFDLDDLPEGKIDNDSDEDQGEFQLIQEEIEEEQQTPALANRAMRTHSDITGIKFTQADTSADLDLDSSLNADGSFNQWMPKDWSRLDSIARDEQADLIAAEVSVCNRIIFKTF